MLTLQITWVHTHFFCWFHVAHLFMCLQCVVFVLFVLVLPLALPMLLVSVDCPLCCLFLSCLWRSPCCWGLQIAHCIVCFCPTSGVPHVADVCRLPIQFSIMVIQFHCMRTSQFHSFTFSYTIQMLDCEIKLC